MIGVTGGVGYSASVYLAGLFSISTLAPLTVNEAGTASNGSFSSTIPVTFTSYYAGSETINFNVSGLVYGAAVASFPDSLNFGGLHVGDSKTLSLKITNAATGALTDTLSANAFNLIESTGDVSFAETGTATAIAAGQSATVAFTVTATSATAADDLVWVDLTSHDNALPDTLPLGSASVRLNSKRDGLCCTSVYGGRQFESFGNRLQTNPSSTLAQ